MADRAIWHTLLTDASQHWIETLQRSALDLDRQGEPGWSDEEITDLLMSLWDRAWNTVEALRPEPQ